MLWFIAGLGYLVLEALAAAAVPSYSYTQQYISALGVPASSPRAYLMNTAFYLQGTLLLLGAVVVVRAVGRRGVLFLVLTAANAVGAFLVATVHSGSALAAGDGLKWHAVGAFLAFLGGNSAIVAGSAIVARAVDAGWWYRAVSLLIAAVGFASSLMLANYAVWTFKYVPVGLAERGAIYSTMAWQIFSAVVLLARPARAG